MATVQPNNDIQLTDELRQQIAAVAETSGKPWQELLSEFIATYRSQPTTITSESAFDVLSRHGIVGSIENGPPDLSSNPKHMVGFGTSPK